MTVVKKNGKWPIIVHFVASSRMTYLCCVYDAVVSANAAVGPINV